MGDLPAADQEGMTQDASLTGSGLYARIVEDIRDQALTAQEVAAVVGVDVRQVSNWATGRAQPKGARRDRLLEVHYVVGLLREVYTREGAEIWLHGRKRSLGGQRPIDLLREGDFETVLHAVERLRHGVM